MPLKSYRELRVWQAAMDLVVAVYRVTKMWPDSERFALTNQAQRAAVSVPSNIAEGYGRAHRKEYLHMLSIARGSLAELETQLIIAHRLGYSTKADLNDCWRQAQKTGRLLRAHIDSLVQALDGDT